MHNKQEFLICSFYKFINIQKPTQLKKKLFEYLKINNVKGTIHIGKEGVNGSVSLKKEFLEQFKDLINKSFSTFFWFKVQKHKSHVFLRLKIKIKNEIVKLGQKEISPSNFTGEFIKPEDWDKLTEQEDVVIVDTRNIYESKIGTFKDSLKPNTNNFTEFPEWIKKNKSLLKNRKIAMFCTGGIRCEKATTFLLKKGFKNVCQLEGGIINYFEKTKNNNKKWNGECFVFDERVTINKNLDKGIFSQCFACRSAITLDDMESKSYIEGISCPHCFSSTSTKQKESFSERQKQINIAKIKGIKHLGS